MLLVALLQTLAPPARAQDAAPSAPPAAPEDGRDDLAWAGVGFDSGLTTGPAGTRVLVSQGEFDVQGTAGPLYLRVDLDFHVDPNLESFSAPPATPEAAFLQIGRGTYRASLGVVNPAIGLQAWDAWDNYLPSFSSTWNFQNGQIAGVMPAIRFDSGAELGVFGGRDMGWGDWTGGAYFATEQDGYSTWSGVSAWPALDYYAAFPSVELYPTDWLWLDVDAAAGLAGGNPFAGGALVLNFFPESEPNPVLRVEKMIDPGGKAGAFLELGVPDTSVSVALNTNPADFVRLSAEGKLDWTDGYASGTGVFYVAFHTPDPETDFSTFEEAGE